MEANKRELVSEAQEIDKQVGRSKPEALIPFNQPFMFGSELEYIEQAVMSRKISGDGIFSKKCHAFFEQHLGFRKALLTTSCTDALELSALLLNLKPGDEVIAPSFTFVSTVNAFLLRGATVRFIDSSSENPNMDVNQIESLISPKTKAIIPVHYAGISCDMDQILGLADSYKLSVVEDAAQALDAYYINRDGQKLRLGTMGELSAFSFHETKNVISGEGGMIIINNEEYEKRAEILREKGTNRSAFFRGEVDKYGWVDIGSSFLPSELVAAYLYAQLEGMVTIQNRRLEIWKLYNDLLTPVANRFGFGLPFVPDYAVHNAHMYYLVTRSLEERDALIQFLKERGVNAVFHYQSLHSSSYFHDKHDGRPLPNSDIYSDRLLRLPFFYNLSNDQVYRVVEEITAFYKAY